MEKIKPIIIAYFILINIVAIAVCVIDKFKAEKKKWRISENTLFVISTLGGSVGMYVAMRLIHHKTRKNRFMLGIPLIILLQAVIVFLIFKNTLPL